MVPWFGIAQIAVALLAAVACVWQFARRRGPNDYSLGATVLVGVLLVAQVVTAIVAPLVGNPPIGDLLEFWMYLITATLLPFGGTLWALVNRKRPANLVLTVINFAVAVMVFRMMVIWG